VVESPPTPRRAFCYIERMKRTNPPGVGAGIVLFYSGYVLLGKRKGAHGEGEWALPGGKVDPNEDPAKTAIRELEEETGIIVPVVEKINFWSWDSYPEITRDFVTLYFRAPWPGNQQASIMEPHKCEAWMPYPWDELPENGFGGLEGLAAEFPDLCSPVLY
jgi:8-oxo-dGTP diphosphatase